MPGLQEHLSGTVSYRSLRKMDSQVGVRGDSLNGVKATYTVYTIAENMLGVPFATNVV